jgi:hypothetical protein
LRVLTHDGFAVISYPDLQSAARLVADDKLLESAYTSPAGLIAPLDILYGSRPSMARGNPYVAHCYGFTQKVLHGTLLTSGFKSVATISRGREPFFDLWALANKSELADDELKKLTSLHFPQ